MLRQHDIIRVLDLEFVAKAADGSVARVALGDIEHAGDVDVTQVVDRNKGVHVMMPKAIFAK